MYTIPEVAQRLGYPWHKQCMWEAGSRMRECYIDQTGTIPVKVLRRKTNRKASGTHFIAVYEPEWLPLMETICHAVHRQNIEVTAQPALMVA